MGTDNEHTEILLTQVAELTNILMDTFASDAIGDSDMETVTAGLERYVQQVEQIAATAGAGEWMGLFNICVLYQAALVPLVGNPDALSEPLLMLLESWPTLVMSYLENPGSPDASEALIECLQDPSWIAPLQADEADMLKGILAEQTAGTPIPMQSEDSEDTTLSDNLFETDLTEEVEQTIEHDAFSSDAIFQTDSPVAEDVVAEDVTEPDSLAFGDDHAEVDTSSPFEDQEHRMPQA